jgi:hypothetical protein
MYGINPPLTREFILSKITEEDIFTKYLCPVDMKHKVCSPLRTDRTPTCDFMYGRNGSLLFVDRSGHFFGDCFEVVKYRFNCGFFQALQQIAKDFNLFENDTTNNIRKPNSLNNEGTHKRQKEKSVIQVKRQLWTQKDVEYWKSFDLNSKILKKYEVASCQIVWLNSEILYTYNEKDPAYVYHYGNGEYKIYFPFREKFRFLMNTVAVQGLTQLPEKGTHLIITKSLKDVMCLKMAGYDAVAPQSEGYFLEPEILNDLKTRFTNILIYFDNDRPGLINAEKFSKEYNLKYITNSLNLPKDFSDFVKYYGLEKGKELITTLVNEKT